MKLDEKEQHSAPLSIGSVVGGWLSPGTTRWNEALDILTHDVINGCRGISSPLNVNVVYQVPGHLLRPEFEGVRTGSYSKKRNLLMVQVALPDEPPDDAVADVKRRLAHAVEEAELWARNRRLASELPELRHLVDEL